MLLEIVATAARIGEIDRKPLGMRLLCRGVSGELTPALLGARPIAFEAFRYVARDRRCARWAASRCSISTATSLSRAERPAAFARAAQRRHHGEHDQRATRAPIRAAIRAAMIANATGGRFGTREPRAIRGCHCDSRRSQLPRQPRNAGKKNAVRLVTARRRCIKPSSLGVVARAPALGIGSLAGNSAHGPYASPALPVQNLQLLHSEPAL